MNLNKKDENLSIPIPSLNPCKLYLYFFSFSLLLFSFLFFLKKHLYILFLFISVIFCCWYFGYKKGFETHCCNRMIIFCVSDYSASFTVLLKKMFRLGYWLFVLTPSRPLPPFLRLLRTSLIGYLALISDWLPRNIFFCSIVDIYTRLFMLCNMYPQTPKSLVIQVFICSTVTCSRIFVGAFDLKGTCYIRSKLKHNYQRWGDLRIHVA